MSLARSISRQKAAGSANGPASPRNNPHRAMTSPEEAETCRRQLHAEDLQGQVGRLEKEREQFAFLSEAVPMGYVAMDEHGTIKDCNRQLETMLSLRRKILLHG